MTTSRQRVAAGAAASLTQEAGLLALCPTRETTSTRPAPPTRQSPAKMGREFARSRLRKGEGGAHGISDCRQLTCAAPPPSARRFAHLGQAPLCALPLLPPAAALLLAASRSWPRVFSRESTADASRCRQSRVASPPLLPRPRPRRRQVAQSPAERLSPRPPPSPAQHLVSAALDRPPFLPKLGIAPGCLSDPAHTAQ